MSDEELRTAARRNPVEALAQYARDGVGMAVAWWAEPTDPRVHPDATLLSLHVERDGVASRESAQLMAVPVGDLSTVTAVVSALGDKRAVLVDFSRGIAIQVGGAQVKVVASPADPDPTGAAVRGTVPKELGKLLGIADHVSFGMNLLDLMRRYVSEDRVPVMTTQIMGLAQSILSADAEPVQEPVMVDDEVAPASEMAWAEILSRGNGPAAELAGALVDATRYLSSAMPADVFPLERAEAEAMVSLVRAPGGIASVVREVFGEAAAESVRQIEGVNALPVALDRLVSFGNPGDTRHELALRLMAAATNVALRTLAGPQTTADLLSLSRRVWAVRGERMNLGRVRRFLALFEAALPVFSTVDEEDDVVMLVDALVDALNVRGEHDTRRVVALLERVVEVDTNSKGTGRARAGLDYLRANLRATLQATAR